jgi:hypothetical protein
MNIAVDPDDGSAEARDRALDIERVLMAVYDQNNLDQLDFDTEIDAAVLGDAAYKVTWDPQERRVRITAPDVQGLFAWWASDDVTRVWRIASRYNIDAESARELFASHDAAPASSPATTPTASSPSSSTPTSANPRSSGARAISPPLRNPSAN